MCEKSRGSGGVKVQLNFRHKWDPDAFVTNLRPNVGKLCTRKYMGGPAHQSVLTLLLRCCNIAQDHHIKPLRLCARETAVANTPCWTFATHSSAEFRSAYVLTVNISNTAPDSICVTNPYFCGHQISTSSKLHKECCFSSLPVHESVYTRTFPSLMNLLLCGAP
jgi:hypothetical protein